MSEKLLVSKIRDGIVIDHIPAGNGMKVLNILKPNLSNGNRVALVVNAESRRMGRKDIVKIEGRYLRREELSLIALVAPTATINVIKDYRVVEKYHVELPETIEGLLRCPNPTCITNKENEPVTSRFRLRSRSPVSLECDYCGTVIHEDEIERYVIR